MERKRERQEKKETKIPRNGIAPRKSPLPSSRPSTERNAVRDIRTGMSAAYFENAYMGRLLQNTKQSSPSQVRLQVNIQQATFLFPTNFSWPHRDCLPCPLACRVFFGPFLSFCYYLRPAQKTGDNKKLRYSVRTMGMGPWDIAWPGPGCC